MKNQGSTLPYKYHG